VFRSTKLSLASVASLVAVCACALPQTALAANHPDSILVKVKPGTDVKALAARHGMKVRRNLPQIHWVELAPRSHAAATASVSKEALAGRVEVDRVVRDVETVDQGVKLNWDFAPRDPLFDEVFMNPPFEPAFTDEEDEEALIAWHFIKTNFPIAWDQTIGTGVRVAVIDSEFDVSNPDLGPKLVQRYNAASGTLKYHTTDISLQAGDEIHGSHTSGLVGAATDNGQGVAGACFECGVIAIKIGSERLGETSFVNARVLGDMAEGLIYAADNGASVISMSLGETRPYQPLQDAVNYAYSKGAVVVASAGNSGPGGDPSYPAAYPNVIAVGATESHNQIARFSNQGPYLDLVAPGVYILSTTNAADPEAFTIEEVEGKPAKVPVAIKSGTSMSAPIVAGLAGLMRAARPDLTPAEVEALMKSTATDLGIAGPDPVYGAGLINAGAAVAAAKAYVRPEPPAPPPAPAPAPAPKKHKKITRIGGKVLLEVVHRKGNVIYIGKLATKPGCRPKRTVLLLAKGSFRPLAKTKTSRRGGFHFKLPGSLVRHKKVRVVVRAKKRGKHALCKGSHSRLLH